MKKIIILVALFIATTSLFLKENQKKVYGYATVISSDDKIVYISSIFSYSSDEEYYKLSDWARVEFADRVDNFHGRDVLIKPTQFSEDYVYVTKDRANLISNENSRGEKRVVTVTFPQTKN